MALVMLPFYYSDGFEYEVITTKTKTNSKPSDAYADFCGLLYGQILEAQAQHRKSLVDLPVDLIISILVLSAASCRSTAKALALTSPWISDVSLPGRLTHVSIRTIRELSAFNELVCSSPHAAGAVRTLWIATNSPLAAEQALIPDVLRACVNLGALACKVGALEALCPSPFFTTMHTVWHGARGSHWPRILDARHGTTFLNNLTHLHLPLYQQEFVVSFPTSRISRSGTGPTLAPPDIQGRSATLRVHSISSRSGVLQPSWSFGASTGPGSTEGSFHAYHGTHVRWSRRRGNAAPTRKS
ncbi:hypothetical protein C8R44DRAFT_787291 [Mycena epipterygia]|nr:hypothetical protein C8R44DRAFT_787291 [Mycena epipterygia]